MGACIEPPANTPEWREWRGCTSKKRYKKFKLAAYKAAILKRDEGHLLEVYKCKFCKGFHLTTKRMKDEDMHISNAPAISTRPIVPSVPVQAKQDRSTASQSSINNLDCSPGDSNSKGGAVVQEIILDRAMRKDFADWMRAEKGYTAKTAQTYALRVNTMPAAKTAYKAWITWIANKPIVLPVAPVVAPRDLPPPVVVDVELPVGSTLSARVDDFTKFAMGEYLLQFSPAGFAVYPLTEESRKASCAELENKLADSRREVAELKAKLRATNERWTALQSILNAEKITE